MKRPSPGRLWLVLLLLLACGGDPRSPETRVLDALDAAERAAEARDVAGVKELISERYADPLGNDRRAIGAWLALRLMEQRTVHVFKHVKSIDVGDGPRADVKLVAGMAGAPVDGLDDLRRLRADVYAIDLVLAPDPDGEWRVLEARWRPAGASDLL